MVELNKPAINGLLARYKSRLAEIRPNELYKWEAAKCFRDNWNPEAEDVRSMLEASLAQSENLLLGAMYYPKNMLLGFAESFPLETMQALDDLLDESKDLRQRLVDFVEAGNVLLAKRNELWTKQGHSPAAQSYMDTRSASVYLSFAHPESHFLYKSNMYRNAAKKLGAATVGNKFDKVIAYRELCMAILDYVEQNAPELIVESDALIPEHLRNVDPAHHMLAQDITYFADRYDEEETWFLSREDYDPGIDVDAWAEMLSDPAFTSENVLITLLCLKEEGVASCSALAEKYGRSFNFYNSNVSSYGEKVIKRTSCAVSKNSSGKDRYWAICCLGKDTTSDEKGRFAWSLRPELAEALEQLDLKEISLYADVEHEDHGDVESAFIDWCIEAGARQEYCAQLANHLAGRSGAGYDATLFLGGRSAFDVQNPTVIADARAQSLKKENAHLNKRNWVSAALAKYAAFLQRDGVECMSEELEMDNEPYLEEDFLSEVYVAEKALADMKALLSRKKNLILQGSPGTGKTFAAKRLAWCLMGEKANGRIEVVQFHQSSTYDEFVVGYRPAENGGFEVQEGVFARFCRKAAADPANDYYLIIDEINRANISKVLGELLMLIEADHRGESLTLAVGGRKLAVPENLYIIGMMNTADRGLALIDYALRRRFAFFEMEPALSHEGFLAQIADEKLLALVKATEKLNETIAFDPTLGRGFRIGHSYFCGVGDSAELVLEYELKPLISEYWFDDADKAKAEIGKLEAAI